MYKELSYKYGKYILTVTYKENNYAIIKVDDLGCLRFPMIFSCGVSYEKANAYITYFKRYGYVDIDDFDNMFGSLLIKE